jgi:RimJ/RimL family protein N-acetyltransferase
MPTIEIKPFSCRADYVRMVDYFLRGDDAFLRGMGVDPARLPSREVWLDRLLPDLDRDDREKQTYYLGWLYDGVPIGHSNVNRIRYGEDAYMHLHSWKPQLRSAGLGTEFCRRAVIVFTHKFALKRLCCEPYAENVAPNRVLSKIGFRLVKRHRTVPGVIAFEQEVNLYVLEHEVSSG